MQVGHDSGLKVKVKVKVMGPANAVGLTSIDGTVSSFLSCLKMIIAIFILLGFYCVVTELVAVLFALDFGPY